MRFIRARISALTGSARGMLAAEDLAYAKKATQAGAQITTVLCEGSSHGFADQIGVLPQAEDCANEIAAMMRRVL